ncbi:MAG: UPF0147 family protein [Nitrosopumilaceae archaeon]|nr:UPF0147 family protein [Nitrosopumilaceae archaeon]
MNKKEQNQKSLDSAIDTLKQVSVNFATPKTIRKNITDLTNELANDGEHAISVRAANAISVLDEITQDPNLPSHVRVTLWQAVSILERIRE